MPSLGLKFAAPLSLAAALLLLALPGLGRAEEHEGGSRSSGSLAAPPAYQQECAACHIAFPARGLPAASWQRLMGDLRHHFGADASLDAPTTQALSTWLQAQAATGRRAQDVPPQDRLTQTAWFQREHRELGPAVWKRPAIGKASNCAACHPGAAEGRFDEHAVRVPR